MTNIHRITDRENGGILSSLATEKYKRYWHRLPNDEIDGCEQYVSAFTYSIGTYTSIALIPRNEFFTIAQSSTVGNVADLRTGSCWFDPWFGKCSF